MKPEYSAEEHHRPVLEDGHLVFDELDRQGQIVSAVVQWKRPDGSVYMQRYPSRAEAEAAVAQARDLLGTLPGPR